MRFITLSRDGTRLGVSDYGGTCPAALLLHGLAGHSGEWDATAERLNGRAHVVAPDARGHGRSERRPADLTIDAQVQDCRFVIEELDLAPVVVVGQSMGGLVAMSLAGSHPDLVRGAVIIEADPGNGDPIEVDEAEAWLRSWPVPFAGRDDAKAFFGGTPGSAAAWADGLVAGEGGLAPQFEIDTLIELLREASVRSHWDEWERIRCPVLIVRGENGGLSAATATSMVDRARNARDIAISDAGHDVHLDSPAAWQRVLVDFLAEC